MESAERIPEPDESPSPMRPDASGDAICEHLPCRITFKPKRSWQRYCCDDHRREANKLRDDGGLRGVITRGPTTLKNGDQSITIRVPAGTDVSHLRPGRVIEIL